MLADEHFRLTSYAEDSIPAEEQAEHRAPCSPGEVHICLSPGEVRFPFCLGAEMMGSMTSLSGSYADSLESQICQDLPCFSEEEQEEEQEQQLHHQSHTADSNGEVQPIGQAWDVLDTKCRSIEELRMELRRATEAILTAEPVSQPRQLEDRHCHGEEEEVEEKVKEDAEWQDGDHQNHYVHICLSPGEVRFPFCLGAEMMGSMTSLSGSYADSLESQICQDLPCFSEEEQEEEQEQQLHHQSHTADSNGEVQPIGQAWDVLDTKCRSIEELRMELRRATEAILTAEPAVSVQQEEATGGTAEGQEEWRLHIQALEARVEALENAGHAEGTATLQGTVGAGGAAGQEEWRMCFQALEARMAAMEDDVARRVKEAMDHHFEEPEKSFCYAKEEEPPETAGPSLPECVEELLQPYINKIERLQRENTALKERMCCFEAAHGQVGE
ncbi:involucrin-like isoform X6 [Hemicordylus capensis]|uniref:involucrin-like isoform X6 n=1 Tax=Hemicordylus capensis TaxID=884348 RepID=UPI002304BCAC|nr:involucrin-like isoform X6 [Hemicordylus capensis]